MRTRRLQGIAFGACLTPFLAFAHHSTLEYDRSVILEFTGQIMRVQWQNPHVRMHIRVRTDDGTDQVWEAEAMDVNSLDRAGVARNLVEVGQVIQFAGSPSIRRADGFLVTNLLLPDGRELLTHSSGAARWNNEAIGNYQGLQGRADEYEAPVDDIFRTWTTVRSNTPAFSANPPLTDAASSAYEAFDPQVDDPVLRCIAPGMPEAMTYIGPHPVGFVQLPSADIEIQIESDDNVRVIHMNDDASPEGQPHSPLGYSVGRWEGETLVVTTTRLNWPYFKVEDLVAVPQSTQMEIVERFALDGERGELTYSFTATDPVNFTETVVADAYHVWRYRPGATIQTYGCTLDE
jgi:hypothetical protein